MNRIIAAGCLAIVTNGFLACGKKDPSGTGPAAPSAGPIASGASALAQPAPPSAAAPSAVASTNRSGAAEAPSSPAPSADSNPEAAPDSFADATPVSSPVAMGLGCETKAKAGWLQLLCRKKNGAGGHPKRAVLGTEGEVPELLPDDQGELKVTLPFRDGAAQSGFVEWTDTKYLVDVKDGELKLEWASSLEMRRSCANLESASKAVVTAAQKAEATDHLTALEADKLPHFGRCQPAGFGSWALGLREVSASGADAERSLKVGIDVTFIDLQGTVTKQDFGVIELKPGGLEIRPLQIFDYDDDGSVELIVPYDLKALPAKAVPAPVPTIWTRKSGQISPYAKAPPLSGGGTVTTHLEFDMRPDIGQYGPFIAYLSNDCGLEKCPPRLVGPVLYAHSLPDGSFSFSDPQAKTSVEKACPKAAALVVESGGVNALRTAQNVACARLRGDDSEKLIAELKSKAPMLCKGGEDCPLLASLVGFAKASFER